MKKPLTDAEAIASIPKLPYGQGSISWIPKRQMYMYKKSIGGERKACYAESVSKVMAEMSKLEKETQQQIKRKEIITLAEAMFQWLDLYKKPILKETSYDTLHKTIRTRIAEHPIGRLRLSAVDSDCIQAHLNSLNESLLSYSTIKKCYDALNDFYRNQTLQKKISLNPMLTVEMLHPEQIIKPTKEIEFFAPKDIQKFEDRATTLLHWSGMPMYQYGFCLCANIYLGMRAGELLALKWKDVDFDTNTIWVHENLQLVRNPLYAKSGGNRQVYKTQSLKNYQNRHIPMNRKAKSYLEEQKKYSRFTSPDDYVCCTRDGKHAAISYLSKNIKEIEKASGTEVQAHGTHVLRHTCASLYFRKGVRIELIAALLGHSVEVCRKTYIHFVEEQKKAAVTLIDDFNITT